jgi:hypothetical protein
MALPDNLDQIMAKYEQDLATQTKSGPWDIADEQRQLNKRLFSMLVDLVPFKRYDVDCFSECDLCYRFLIANRWNVENSAKAMRANAKWRMDNKVNEILWAQFPDELAGLIRFHTVDMSGRPVYLWRPHPSWLNELMNKYPREQIIMYYVKVIEQGRRISLSLNVDRITCLLDLSMLGMRQLTNVKAMGLIKEISGLIQREFPENLHAMLCCNGGWTLSGVMKVLGAVLDERVMKKVQNIGSGDKMKEELAKWIPLNSLPASYGGTGTEVGRPFRALAEIPSSPVGSPPQWSHGAYKASAFADVGPSEAELAAAAAAAARDAMLAAQNAQDPEGAEEALAK